MRKLGPAAATALVAISMAAPTGARAADSTSTTSQITPTPPARLTSTTPAATTPAAGGTLPNTGYDLLPESALGLALLTAGVALRLRRRRT